MSLLLNCQSLEKSFGSRRIFADLSLGIFSGDRIGLIGPNGAGKSTLLKILVGQELPDAGIVSPKKHLRIGYVPQSSEFRDISPHEVLLERLQEESLMPDYEKERLAQTWLSKMGFRESDNSAQLLSGGWKKRLAIALELLTPPDLLLLDEPTNHLDLEGVLWFEKFLLREVSTFIIVSHDRYILQNLTNRTVEINSLYPEGLFSVEGSHANFLEKKQLFMEGQRVQERSFATKARRETHWLRQTAKARTTKSQSRIDKAQEILQEHAELRKRNTQKKADIQFETSRRQTRKLLVANNVGLELGNRPLFQHLDITLSPGTRLGLMGVNGSGKTSFLRLLTGELSPTHGTIKPADDLKIVYFDQHRAKLSLDLTLREALAPTGDYVFFRKKPIHIIGWCKRFLFSPDMLDMPLKKLSGGERARIAIAHLMLQPADLLLLDEPTNDLDIPTLETLEESLIDFPGAVVLITHDRYMLDRLCNIFLALGNPEETQLYADYAQWESAQRRKPAPQKPKGAKKVPTSRKKDLSFKERRECEQIEKAMGNEEKKLQELNSVVTAASTVENPQKLQKVCKQIAETQSHIDSLYHRWAELHKL
ncbi:MAG: ABC transporter ATP-binding protein uup [Chlamydiae bacterium]|nr:ABC transporter ATP-binding protein uup [Chlamydiota bacterium]